MHEYTQTTAGRRKVARTEGPLTVQRPAEDRRLWTADELREEAAGLMEAEGHIEAAREALRGLPSRSRGMAFDSMADEPMGAAAGSPRRGSESIGGVLRSLSLARGTLQSRADLAANSAVAVAEGVLR